MNTATYEDILRRQTHLFYGVCLGFLVGVFVRSLVFISAYGALFLILVSCACLLRRKTLVLACIIASCALGMLRYGSVDHEYGNATFDALLGQEVEVDGIVVTEPVRKDAKETFVIKSNDVKIRVLSEMYPSLRYGDNVTIKGTLKRPENFENDDTGRTFNYVAFLKKDGIAYQMMYPQVHIVSRGHGNPLQRWLFSSRRAFVETLSRTIPEPHTGLVAGVTVGEDTLSRTITDSFRATGIVHIVVLSGYNVSLVLESVMKMLSWAPLVLRSVMGFVGIVVFALFTGATATVVRASIMASCVVLGRLIGKDYNVMRALICAGVVMVCENPFVLVFDPSFQLSFLATLALIVVVPILEPMFSWIPVRFNLRDLVVTTLSTQILVLPLLLYMTGTLSLVFLPVNILVLPCIPLLMFLGFIVGIVGMISKYVVVPFVAIVYALSKYVFILVDFFGGLSYAQIRIPFVGEVLLVVSYIVLGCGIVLLTRRMKGNTFSVHK